MALTIAVIGPIHDGQPQISVRASGNYAPDVMDDLKNRLIELYEALFMDPPEDDATASDEPVAGIGQDDGDATGIAA